MNRAERRRQAKLEAKLERPAQPTGRQRCAVHEAGHVVVARSFGLPVSEVTIDSTESDAFGELEEIEEIIRAKRESVEALVSALVERGTLNEAEIVELVG